MNEVEYLLHLVKLNVVTNNNIIIVKLFFYIIIIINYNQNNKSVIILFLFPNFKQYIQKINKRFILSFDYLIRNNFLHISSFHFHNGDSMIYPFLLNL